MNLITKSPVFLAGQEFPWKAQRRLAIAQGHKARRFKFWKQNLNLYHPVPIFSPPLHRESGTEWWCEQLKEGFKWMHKWRGLALIFCFKKRETFPLTRKKGTGENQYLLKESKTKLQQFTWSPTILETQKANSFVKGEGKGHIWGLKQAK